MSELVVIERAEVVPTLDELAATINQEHDGVLKCLAASVEAAVRAGEALIQARGSVPRGSWLAWVKSNVDATPHVVQAYIRIATYQEIARAAPSWDAALTLLRGLPRVNGTHLDDNFAEDAQKLRDAGWSYPNIATALGVSASAVMARLNPAYKLRNEANIRNLRKKQRTQARVERAAARAVAAEKAGGGISQAFRKIREAQQTLSNLSETGATHEIKLAATIAYRAVCRAEDEIAKILADA